MTSPPPAIVSSYLLLFRNGGPEAHTHLTSEQRTALTNQWNTWIDRMVAQGVLDHGRLIV